MRLNYLIFPLLFSLSLGINPELDAQKPNNVILVLIDDLGWMDLGCYGSTYYNTPNLDRFATDGMRFTQAYSAHPTCSPTRASILTGQYPARLKLTSFIPGVIRPHSKLNPPEGWRKYVRMSELTYAEVFRDNGYETFHAGKWHMGVLEARYHGFEAVVENNYNTINPDDPKNVFYYTEAAISFIKENKKNPFLAVISHNTVHVPHEARPDLEELYEQKPTGGNGQNNATMGAMIEYLDQSFGHLISSLKKMGIMDHTYIIFFSDNGGLSNIERRIATSNLPLRSGKSQCYEGGIRVPMIVAGPGIGENTVADYPVISMDLYPTMLALAGIGLKPDAHKDGINLLPILKGEKKALERSDLFWHYPHYQTLPPHGAARSGDWKIVENYETGKIELFHLSEDIAEAKDLSASFPEKLTELKELLNRHLKEVEAPMPTLNYSYNPGKDGRGFESYDKLDPEEMQQPDYLELTGNTKSR